MKMLVLGIGNPILGDDGVGFHVAQELSKKINREGENTDVDIKDASISGLNLLEMIIGYDKVALVDAIKTKNGNIGEVYKLKPEDFTSTIHVTSSPHDTNLATAIRIGNELAAEQMPKEIVVFGVEVKEVTKFTEEMSEKVKEAIPRVVNLILGMWKSWHK
jgi:hydrogenase maturation protease